MDTSLPQKEACKSALCITYSYQEAIKFPLSKIITQKKPLLWQLAIVKVFCFACINTFFVLGYVYGIVCFGKDDDLLNKHAVKLLNVAINSFLGKIYRVYDKFMLIIVQNNYYFDEIKCVFDEVKCVFDEVKCVFDEVKCVFDEVKCVFDEVKCVFDEVKCVFDEVKCVFDEVKCVFDDLTY